MSCMHGCCLTGVLQELPTAAAHAKYKLHLHRSVQPGFLRGDCLSLSMDVQKMTLT